MRGDERHHIRYLLGCLLLCTGLAGAQDSYLVTMQPGPWLLHTPAAVTLWDGTVGSYDDDAATIPLGFTFTYFGVPYTEVTVSCNGYLTFGGYGRDWSNEPIPSDDVTSPDAVIAPWWDDLLVSNRGLPDIVLYEQRGAVPGSRTLVVTWSEVSMHGDTAASYNSITFQVTLFEADDSIEFRYRNAAQVGVPLLSSSASLGVEDDTGLVGLDPFLASPDLGLGDFPAGQVIRFTPPGPDDYIPQVVMGSYVTLGAGSFLIWDGAAAPPGGFDNTEADLPLGFDFTYYGLTYSTVRISTNGYLTFPPALGSVFTNTAIPDPAVPDPVIAPWWDDLRVTTNGATDQVRAQYIGPAGDRVLVVEWRSISHAGDLPGGYHYLNFQVGIFEDGHIEFHYGNSGVGGAPPLPVLTASLGIEDSSGTLGTAPVLGSPLLDLSRFPPPGTIIAFLPPPLLCGDCNGDGVTSILDGLHAAQAGLGLIMWTSDAGFVACNVAGTPGGRADPGATVDVLDALTIAQYVAGIGPALECGR